MFRYRSRFLATCAVSMGLASAASRSARAEDWVEVLPPLQRAGAARTDPSFGTAVSVSGSAILAGASTESDGESRSGAAYVFSGDRWQTQADILPDPPVRNGQFGGAVSLRGRDAMIGTGTIDGGAVYFFSLATGTWKLSASFVPKPVDTYGFRVALGNGFAVSAEPKSGADVGRVCSYRRENGTWVSEPDLVATEPANEDFFGYQLSLNGNTLAVGAPTNLVYPTDRASVYVFVRENGSWDKGTRLTIDGPPEIAFGNGVSVHGDTLLVAAPPGPEKKNNGKALVYVRSGKTWTLQQTLTMPDEETFGAPVLVQGDTAWVGARTAGSTSLYVFSRSGTTWTQMQKLSTGYSFSMAVNGGTLALGEAFNGGVGAVHVFRNATQDSYGDPDLTGSGGTDAGIDGSDTGGASATDGGATGSSGGATGTANGGATQSTGGAAASSGGGSGGTSAGGATSAAGNGGDGGSTAAPPGAGNGNDSSGCGCRLSSRANDARSLAVVLMGLALLTARLRAATGCSTRRRTKSRCVSYDSRERKT